MALLDGQLMQRKPVRPKSGRTSPAKRIPLERQIEMRFPHFEGFVTRVSANMSTRGMFIQTDKPEPVDTEFAFRFRIEEWSLIQGTARVVWTRIRSEGSDRPSGMGVEFIDLDAQSRRMIRYLIDKHVQEGGEPFVLGAAPEADRSRPGVRKRGARRWRRWAVLAVTLTALAAAAYGVYLFWFASGQRPFPRPRPAGPAEAELGKAEPQATAPDDIGTSGSDAKTAADIESVTALIRGWAAAWSSKQSDEVLALYSPDFVPEGSVSRARWQADLERSIRQARHIRVAISALEISFPNSDLARASFYRSYRSDISDRTTRMVLDLELADGGWRILREQTVE